MSTPFLSEIKVISWNFAPKGWALCNGQLLPINQNQALFSLLGTYYGGDGRTTFALPDLRGRTPVHMGNGILQGERGGEEVHTLTLPELPAHNHTVMAANTAATQRTPVGNVWAQEGTAGYGTVPNVSMNATAIGQTGGSQPHLNMQPYLVLNFVIALQGIFPSPT